MKKIALILALTLLIPSLSFSATPQHRHGSVIMGMLQNYDPSATTLALNAANTWLALGFVVDSSLTLSKVKAFTSAIAGTQALISVSCDIYSDVAGVPNASIAGPYTVTNLAAGWWEWTGASLGLTAGTQYWAVFKNTAVAPTVDYPTFRFGGILSSFNGVSGSSNVKYGWGKVHTTDAGTAWATSAINSIWGGIRLEFSTPTAYLGFPFSQATLSSAKAYGTNEVGAKFTTPSNSGIKVRGIGGFIRKTASPTGTLSYVMRWGASSAETHAIPNANVVTLNTYQAYFSTVQTISAGTSVRITVKNSAADDSSNYWTFYEYTVENDANSRTLLPMAGTWMGTYTANGTDWTDTNTLAPIMWLILDTDGEFPVVTGGTGGGAWAF